MTTTRLRILHISDLHLRGAGETDHWRRHEVLGAPFDKTLNVFRKQGPIDLVFFTGDLANWGTASEYGAATEFVENVLTVVDVPKDRFFLVPGNHDINRKRAPRVRTWLRDAAADASPQSLSRWMAGKAGPPAGFTDSWRETILTRESEFWNWVENDLGRPQLHPRNSAHKSLGYRVTLDTIAPFPIHVIGIDTAWLAGERFDAGKLHVTEDQIMLLSTEAAGHPLAGLRLVLMHHPLSDLADYQTAERRLADNVDFVFRGHTHYPRAQLFSDPNRKLRVLAAGCLYDVEKGPDFPNECQLIELELSAEGVTQSAHVVCHSWGAGGFWYSDNQYYEDSTDGRIELAALVQASPVANVARITLLGNNLMKVTSVAGIHGSWGDPTVGISHPITLIIEGRFELARELVDTVFRIGLHGGLNAVCVDSPDRWNEAGHALIACIGMQVQHWMWSTSSTSAEWRIIDRLTAPLAGTSGMQEMTVSDFVANSKRRMDAWAWDRLKLLVDETLAGNETHLFRNIHEETRLKMREIWRGWQGTLDSAYSMMSHFLAAMLTTATPLRSDSAHARLGPRAVARGLLKAVIFALAVEAGLSVGSQPKVASMPVNLVFSDEDAHIVALELMTGHVLHLAPMDLSQEPPFLLLANCSVPQEELAHARQRVGSTRGPIRVGDTALTSPFTFTASPDFDRALMLPLAQLGAHLRSLVSLSLAASRKRIADTSELS